MKKYLLPEQGNFYKANLHMHTTVSDGRMTPEETKKLFMEHGYSIVAFTDHDVICPHHDLTDENFLAITSFETYYNTDLFLKFDFNLVKTYHLSFFAKDPDNVVCPAFSERYIERAHSLAYVTDEMRRYDFDREYSQKCINEVIRRANEAGFLVSYNHPAWSMQNYKDYGELKGLWGVEVYNTSGAKGCPDNEQAFVDLLREGENVFPIAADDAHSTRTCCGGFVMVKAEKLEYKTVMSALEKGDFYASNGPEFFSLSVEDGILRVECSDAHAIFVNTERRDCFYKEATDAPLTEAEFNLNGYLKITRETPKEVLLWKPFIRVTVQAKDGSRAYTRAYWLDEL
ncbi:MAG: PHP domain-containing protein [Clostridia bacterium]|nr:PHP domain-containing protein [Clostridia bacterium]